MSGELLILSFRKWKYRKWAHDGGLPVRVAVEVKVILHRLITVRSPQVTVGSIEGLELRVNWEVERARHYGSAPPHPDGDQNVIQAVRKIGYADPGFTANHHNMFSGGPSRLGAGSCHAPVGTSLSAGAVQV
ncbi:hypothetical protein [Streptosporangium sp. NPDC000396]|uniref:hypothetical protein n=1 Tax=Streptosporangium sp. NPDC000396 TaxID=3366185 RepID=UPI0036BFBB13